MDERLTRLDAAANASFVPDQDGTLDRIEYFAGFGFVACQVYISNHANHANHAKIGKADALDAEPNHQCGTPIVALSNAAANLWKHKSEWSFDYSTSSWQRGALRRDACRTIQVLEQIGLDTRPGYYSAANALYEITRPHPARFATLIPFLLRWKDGLYP